MSVLRWFSTFTLAMTLGCGGGEADPHAGHTAEGTASHAANSEEHARGGGDHAAAGHEGHVAMPATAPVPDTSLVQLTSAFTDEQGRAFAFSSLAGHPTLVAMFYGSCETVCPIILQDLATLDAALSAEERARLRVLLVTFDPERDTAARLTALGAEKGFDPTRWSFLRGDDSSIRELSMVLGVQYRRLPDGNFSHSALITLLDPEGRIVERMEGLHADNAAMLARLRSYR